MARGAPTDVTTWCVVVRHHVRGAFDQPFRPVDDLRGHSDQRPSVLPGGDKINHVDTAVGFPSFAVGVPDLSDVVEDAVRTVDERRQFLDRRLADLGEQLLLDVVCLPLDLGACRSQCCLAPFAELLTFPQEAWPRPPFSVGDLRLFRFGRRCLATSDGSFASRCQAACSAWYGAEHLAHAGAVLLLSLVELPSFLVDGSDLFDLLDQHQSSNPCFFAAFSHASSTARSMASSLGVPLLFFGFGASQRVVDQRHVGRIAPQSVTHRIERTKVHLAASTFCDTLHDRR